MEKKSEGKNKALVLRYTGRPHKRIVGNFVWSVENDWPVTVPFDSGLVETLLAQKSGGQDEFEVVEDGAE